ncbi:hypothetical protein SELMODRAFT_427920 [Selaginella moellendorffii]|uniref:Uncharacterized protein n=1 Tax=Selaginella moellendorffii TaxID=88036 RepID=D8T142_SELML|nr:hypothetical protein SELMODRAFT_432363 [Selaginella moellendorffii]EFJ09571.1 hypothetical protein SELMODRAFT_427916 [Selaginella moellendorffii]EFJ09573.1 hypothetical protein SELMODRAFT_427920 [Selaginella moellendorffii]
MDGRRAALNLVRSAVRKPRGKAGKEKEPEPLLTPSNHAGFWFEAFWDTQAIKVATSHGLDDPARSAGLLRGLAVIRSWPESSPITTLQLLQLHEALQLTPVSAFRSYGAMSSAGKSYAHPRDIQWLTSLALLTTISGNPSLNGPQIEKSSHAHLMAILETWKLARAFGATTEAVNSGLGWGLRTNPGGDDRPDWNCPPFNCVVLHHVEKGVVMAYINCFVPEEKT